MNSRQILKEKFLQEKIEFGSFMLKIHPKLKETFSGYSNLLMLSTAQNIAHNRIRVDETYDLAR
jgi:hypothetical protein